MKINIKLDSIDAVREFVNTVNRFTSDFDLISGRYVIDAKSIMGIFSLDLSKQLVLEIHENNNEKDALLEALKPFMA